MNNDLAEHPNTMNNADINRLSVVCLLFHSFRCVCCCCCFFFFFIRRLVRAIKLTSCVNKFYESIALEAKYSFIVEPAFFIPTKWNEGDILRCFSDCNRFSRISLPKKIGIKTKTKRNWFSSFVRMRQEATRKNSYSYHLLGTHHSITRSLKVWRRVRRYGNYWMNFL